MIRGCAVILLLATSGAVAEPVPPLPDVSTAEPQVRAAIIEAHDALEGEPESAARWGRYALTLDAHGFTAEAAGMYRIAARLEPDEFRWPYLLAVLLAGQDPVASLRAFDRARELNAEYAPLYVRYGALAERTGAIDEALQAYREALRIDDRSAFAHAGLGRCLLENGDAGEARTHLERAIEIEPECRPALTELAACHRLAGDMVAAAEYAERAASARVRMQPDQVVLKKRLLSVSTTEVLRRVHALREVGRDRQARQQLMVLLDGNPGSVRGLNKLGEVLLEEGDAAAAEAQFRKATELDPDFVAAQLGLGQTLTRLGRLDEAQALYEKVIAEHPDSARAHTGLGACLAEQGRMDLAAGSMLKALELAPDDERARLGYGWALYHLGDYQGSLDTLKPLIDGASDPPGDVAVEALGSAGLAQMALERNSEAVETLRRALSGAPTRSDLRRDLAIAYRKAGRDGEAAGVLERGLSLDWRDGSLAVMLVRILSTSPQADVRDGAEAVRLAERLANATERSNAEVLGALACAYAENGRYREAADTAREALALIEPGTGGALAEALQAQLAAFEAGEPWRAIRHEP